MLKISILIVIMLLTSISVFIIYSKTNINDYTFLSLGNNSDYDSELSSALEKLGYSVTHNNYVEEDISISELNNDIIYNKNNLKEHLKEVDIVILSIGKDEIEKEEDIDIVRQDLINLIMEIKKYNNNIYLINNYLDFDDIYKNIASDYNLTLINTYNITANKNLQISKMITKALSLNSVC